MILGMSIYVFTVVHVIISLIAIAAGLVVMFGMVRSKALSGWTAIFLLMTVLTSVTGFMFLQDASFRKGITPALATGIVSSVVLAIALYGLYLKHLAGRWRWIYVASALAALYLNVFVLIVQSFLKLSILNPAAPQAEPPFAEPANTQFIIAQAVALVFFVVGGIVAAIKFRPGVRMPV